MEVGCDVIDFQCLRLQARAYVVMLVPCGGSTVFKILSRLYKDYLLCEALDGTP